MESPRRYCEVAGVDRVGENRDEDRIVRRNRTLDAKAINPMKLTLQNLKNREHGWAPLIWMVYLGFFFIQPIADHVSRRIWLLDLLGAGIFIVLYFGLFFLERPRAYVHIGGMLLLGVIYLPI